MDWLGRVLTKEEFAEIVSDPKGMLDEKTAAMFDDSVTVYAIPDASAVVIGPDGKAAHWRSRDEMIMILGKVAESKRRHAARDRSQGEPDRGEP